MFQGLLEEKYGARAQSILTQAYLDVQQKVSSRKAESSFKGKVIMEFIEEDKDSEEGKYIEQVIGKLPVMVMELQDRGYSLKDIAFLVRRKTEGETVVHTMMQAAADFPEYRFDVLSDEAMFLRQAASVKALMAGLKYLFDPADMVAYTTMWYYRAVIFGQEISHELFDTADLPEQLRPLAEIMEQRMTGWLQLPLTEMLEELIETLGLSGSGKERAYLSGFREAVFDFVGKNRADLAGFLDWWEENSDKRTVKIPDGHDAMRILTIHKSKGLQYKAVIMPFLDWKIFDVSKGNILWSPFQSKGLPPTVIPLSLNKDLACSAFEEIYEGEETMAHLDTLNMVYVALTRAEEVFWSLSPYREIKKGCSMNYLGINLQNLLENGTSKSGEFSFRDFYDRDSKVLSFGEWGEATKNPASTVKHSPLRWNYLPWQSLLEVRQLTGGMEDQDGLLDRKRKNGLLIHKILEHSKTYAETAVWLDTYHFEGQINEEEKSALEERLQKLFRQEKFKSWFQGEGVLLAEQGILLPGGDQKRPDRIILEKDKATVVDFKTGEEKPHYLRQVLSYMELVAKITKLPVQGFLCYVETGKILEVKRTVTQPTLFD